MREVVSARIGALRLTVSSLLLSLLAAHAGAQVGTSPVAGIADRTPRTVALTHARLVIKPGSVVEDGTLLIRDGMIVAAGSKVAVPADAAVTDLGGRSVFAGFIDAGSDYGQPAPAPAARGEGMGRTPAAPKPVPVPATGIAASRPNCASPRRSSPTRHVPARCAATASRACCRRRSRACSAARPPWSTPPTAVGSTSC
ncbi:MAG: hypothetical protein NVV68_00170 [Dokdonella sp.]|nr:hypothetical protein [Dokdonella sp.]